MRKNIIAGNWKMNATAEEAKTLTTGLIEKISTVNKNIEVIVCPPFIHLSPTITALKESPIFVGAQNCYFHDKGAFTGEVSASMLKNLGCSHVIIGHSERRSLFNETNELLLKKVEAALDAGLRPIFCVGESLEEREDDKHFQVIKSQIEEVLYRFGIADILEISIAYEPVWAIGTGKAATADQAQEMHSFIRGLIRKQYDESVANVISILYGGSVKPSNAKEIFSKPDIDGGLIGGASLKAQDFVDIAQAF